MWSRRICRWAAAPMTRPTMPTIAGAVEIRGRTVSWRPAVRTGHPDRRTGHEPVRRAASAIGWRARSWPAAVLVLDDTLSALDVRRAAVTDALRGTALARVTTIVVAHRASTVLLADRSLRWPGAPSPRRHPRRLLATVPRYRYLLAADDELDDGADRSQSGSMTPSTASTTAAGAYEQRTHASPLR